MYLPKLSSPILVDQKCIPLLTSSTTMSPHVALTPPRTISLTPLLNYGPSL
ncbi:hypothetical protein Hanom_Chr07g00600231 [Helianthus anomalus]